MDSMNRMTKRKNKVNYKLTIRLLRKKKVLTKWSPNQMASNNPNSRVNQRRDARTKINDGLLNIVSRYFMINYSI